MNKGDLVDALAAAAGVSKKAAAELLEAFIGVVKKTLKKGDKITIPGFGSFSKIKRAARNGVNPATGEKIKIKARNVAKFAAGKALKEAVA